MFVLLCPAFKELNTENAEKIYDMFHCEERRKIEQYCSSAEFRITKSYDKHSTQQVFQTIDSLLNWLWSSTERLQRYYPYSSRDGKPPFDLRGTVKQGPGEIETVHEHSQT